MAAASVPKLYGSVIDDVINNVREIFLDDGIDEQVLLELKQTWERKLLETKAIEHKDPENNTGNQGSNGQSASQQSSTNQRQNASRNAHLSRDQNSQNTSRVDGLATPQPQNSSQSNRVQQQHSQQQQQKQSRQQQSQSQRQTQPQVPERHKNPSVNQSPAITNSGLAQPNFIQYPSEGVGVEKAGVPQKVAFTYNPTTSTVMSSPATTALATLPPEITASLLQQFNPNNVIGITHPQATTVVQQSPSNSVGGRTIQYQTTNSSNIVPTNPRSSQPNRIVQLDGPNDSSDDDEEEDEYRDNDDDHEDNDDEQNDDENEYTGEEEEPLNSEDDVSDEDPLELFDTDNVVVCQYDKITRSRNKWKFHLKDGIMNLQGKDYVFQKAMGDAEW